MTTASRGLAMARWVRLGTFAALVAAGGCFGVASRQTAQSPAPLPASRDTPLFLDLPDHPNLNRPVTATQVADLAKDLDLGTASTSKSPKENDSSGIVQVSAQVPAAPQMPEVASGVQQARQPDPNAVKLTRVRAWVGGKPIFDDEVMMAMAPLIPTIKASSFLEREEELKKLFFKVLDKLIDDELLVQDAMRKMRENPKAVEEVKTAAMKKSEERVAEYMRNIGVPTLDELKRFLMMRGTTVESVRRSLERDYIATEYLKSLVQRQIKSVSHEQIRGYYEDHINEFQQVDKVKWLDIFIAVGPKHPTQADALAFAQDLRARWAGGEDFKKLLEFDDGDSLTRKGEGAGQLKGDIRPRELEPILFALKAGEIAPPFELSTGVHVFSVVQRDSAGTMPFDEGIQRKIDNKLKNEVFERERAQICQGFRDNTVIEIDRNFP
jgi:parvulin-like peptidyl-prolyl isomerase